MKLTNLLDLILSKVASYAPSLRYLSTDIKSSLKERLSHELPPLEAIIHNNPKIKYDRTIFRRDRYGNNVSLRYSSKSGLLSLSPFFSSSTLDNFYANDYQTVYGRTNNSDHVIKRQIFRSYIWNDLITSSVAHLYPSINTLEIGASYGYCSINLNKIFNGAITTYVYEPSQAQASLIRQKFLNVKVLDDLVDFNGSLDFIFADHVFEHILDPFSFLKACISNLSASGMMCFALPLVERFDEITNKPFICNIHIAHCHYYTFKSLTYLAHHLNLALFEYRPTCRDLGECFICFVPHSNSPLINKLNSIDCFENLTLRPLDKIFYKELPSKLRNKLFYSSLLVALSRVTGRLNKLIPRLS